MRFALARKDRQLESARRKLTLVQGGSGGLEEEDRRLTASLHELDEIWEFVLTCNRPTVLERTGFERLTELGKITLVDDSGATQPLLAPLELERLSIPKGSLSEFERREIESHVTHTFRFLSLIPWTRDLKRVPEIAYAHHERADGSGYPRGMPAVSIPVQSKMMAISDVYDALTAADRPYKKALPHQRALDILHLDAKSGKLDSELLRVFIEAEIPKKVLSA